MGVVEEVVELYDPGAGSGAAPGRRLVLTCEHASATVPPPLRVEEDDRPWLGTHWAVDLGAAEATRELARLLSAAALLAGFSRLVCDANRSPQSETLIPAQVEGYTPSFNRDLDDLERERRLQTLHAPYHAAVDHLLQDRLRRHPREALLLLSIHSFTPVLGAEVREMELGVLFDDAHAERARRAAATLGERGFVVALNAPYSGYEGMIYSAWRHGQAHGVPYLELELRQDMLDTTERARSAAGRVATVVAELLAHAG